MDTYKFRAKPKYESSICDECGFVYGDLIHEPYGSCIQTFIQKTESLENCAECALWKRVKTPVILETVGQFTGYRDVNGVDVYDGDICKDDGDAIVQILWYDNFCWGGKILKGCTLALGLTFPLWQWKGLKENGYRKLEKIGNIYDNKNLMI